MNPIIHNTIESFPPLPESIRRLNDLCSGDEINLKSVISVIESDPLLYTDILRYSNVPSHGFRHSITSISQSISLFGVSAIRGMALTAALKAHPYNDVSMYGITSVGWFETMNKQQQFLDIWLLKNHRSIVHSLGGLTFILEIGRLLASYALSLSQLTYQFDEHEPHKLRDEEYRLLGYTGDELAADLFIQWNFDPLFIDSLRYSLNPGMGSDRVCCAVLQCARMLFTLKETKTFDEIESILREYDFKIDDAKTAYEMVLSLEE